MSLAKPARLSDFKWAETATWIGGDFSEDLVSICYEDHPQKKYINTFGRRTLIQLCGYRDRTGKLVINPRFNSVGSFHEGLAMVGLYSIGNKKGGNQSRYYQKFGFIDKSGKVVISVKFTEVTYFRFGNFSEGLAAVRGANGRAGYINKQGQFVIRPKYLTASDFHEGVATVDLSREYNTPHKYAYINKQGEVIKHILYDEGNYSSEGLILDRDAKGKLGYLNNKGRVVIPYQFDTAWPFSEGLAAVSKKNEKGTDSVGYIDKFGRFIISLDNNKLDFYHMILPFHDGLALTKNDNGDRSYNCKYIDSSGNTVIKIDNVFHCTSFSDGLATVLPKLQKLPILPGDIYYIDQFGKKVFSSPKYNILGEFRDGIVRAQIKSHDSLYSYPNSVYLNKRGEAVFGSPLRGIPDK
jgi:WG containing repeat